MRRARLSASLSLQHRPATIAPSPNISVVVPSHGRRLRLLWLLNALEEQTIEQRCFEAIVVHDYDQAVSEWLDRHPLARSGTLRQVRIAPASWGPSRKRNIGWQMARAPLVAFTDDDCRPAPGWLEELLATAQQHPGAIVQGATRADPLEVELFAGPHARSLHVDPPGPFAQTCNILYPREALQRVGGFEEKLTRVAGEDLDLALRVRRSGAGYEGAPRALVYHAVESYSLLGMMRLNLKWQDTAYLVKRHPEIRRRYRLRVFWRESHYRLAMAAVGLGLARRRPAFGVLALPYLRDALGSRGTHRRARLAAALELPGRVIVDVGEVLVLIRGSVRHHTLVL